MTVTGIGNAQRAAALLLAVGLAVAGSPAWAWQDLGLEANGPYDPHGGYVTDGSYVMNKSELQINITNWGLIGSHYSNVTRYSEAPSAQWPAGSGDEYLWAAGLWVGGVLLGERLVSTGQFESEIRARGEIPEDTIYEAIGGQLVRPVGNVDASGRRYPEPDPNDDEDVYPAGHPLAGEPRIDEEVLNGFDDDQDGLIDEDFGQIGNQMMVTTMFDNTRLAQEAFADHTPLNLEITQESFAWENDQTDDFVAFQFSIKNIGVTNIANMYIGFFADSDIGARGGEATASDDMAGSFSGAVRASDGSWVPVEVGYMYDYSESARLPGYFGIAFLSHDVDPSGQTAPTSVKLNSFQIFSGQQSFEDGGDPVNDGERYELLARTERDGDTADGKQDDYRFLVSAGPFATLPPDETLRFQAALAVGPGRDGLLQTCAEAALTWYGNYFNVVSDNLVSLTEQPIVTGELGRESIVCREDFANAEDFNQIRPDYGDVTCMPAQFLLDQPRLTDDDMFMYERKTCAMVNMDNCFECFRRKPHTPNETAAEAQCGPDDIERYMNCNVPSDADAGCTGVDGNETQVHWLVGMAPPPPGLRVWPTAGRVHVFWDDLSEVTPDVRINEIDFEAYRVWRADNWTRPHGSSLENGPESNLWQLIAEYDVVDSMVVQLEHDNGDIEERTLPLGPNTGLEQIAYQPPVLDDPRFAGLAEAMQAVVDARPLVTARERPPLRDPDGEIYPDMLPLAPWASYAAALDTFWAVTGRASRDTVIDGEPVLLAAAKDPVKYYEYVDHNVHNGYIYFYSVTAADHELRIGDDESLIIGGAGQSGDPSSSFIDTTPAKRAQTAAERDAFGANIFAYPNPATREALAGFQPLFPNADDPTGVRVNFANLPQARNSIKIYTLSGDLVQTIEHDGTGGDGEVSWNLISRNGQEIVSGIYLFVVQSDDDRFEDFIGKFVVVR